MKYVLIFCLLLGGCTMLKHIQDSSDYLETGKFPCPEGEHCMDLTKRMGGIEGEIFKTLPPIKGWKQIGCIHSKQLDPSTIVEQMYCEYCNKEDHQMWMIYDYGDETWTMSDQEWLNICGDPHPLFNKEISR